MITGSGFVVAPGDGDGLGCQVRRRAYTEQAQSFVQHAMESDSFMAMSTFATQQPVARTTTKAWKRALERAGIEDVRWHDLRHTLASWHVQRGAGLQELMDLGGWSSFEMVLRYAHLAGEHLKQAASLINGTKPSQHHQRKDIRLIG